MIIEVCQILREAMQVIKSLRFGDDCFCEVAIGNPNFGGEHSNSCLAASAFVEKVGAK